MRYGVTTTAVRQRAALVALVAAFAAAPSFASAQSRTRYLWNLSTETGAIRTSAHGLSFDPFGHEILVTGGDLVRIFKANGMEDFSFSVAGMLERVLAAGVLGESGDIVLLGVKGQRWSLERASFRGEHLASIEISGAPAGFVEAFGPTMMRVHEGRIYLADLYNLRALVIGQDGAVERAVDLAAAVGVDEKKLGDVQLTGFGVDVDGSLLFTIAVWFKAYALSPAGELREWGTPGGSPGLFNVVSGIAADARNYYVADQLKCAVIAFDRRSLEFVDEFGYRRPQAAGGLIGPTQVAAGDGKVFVSQNGDRGVAVFLAPAAGQELSAVTQQPRAGEDAATQ